MKYKDLKDDQLKDVMPAASGIFGGSVCVKKGTKDSDILFVINNERGHPGTSAGWCMTKFKRKRRVKCPDYKGREHAAYTC